MADSAPGWWQPVMKDMKETFLSLSRYDPDLRLWEFVRSYTVDAVRLEILPRTMTERQARRAVNGMWLEFFTAMQTPGGADTRDLSNRVRSIVQECIEET